MLYDYVLLRVPDQLFRTKRTLVEEALTSRSSEGSAHASQILQTLGSNVLWDVFFRVSPKAPRAGYRISSWAAQREELFMKLLTSCTGFLNFNPWIYETIESLTRPTRSKTHGPEVEASGRNPFHVIADSNCFIRSRYLNWPRCLMCKHKQTIWVFYNWTVHWPLHTFRCNGHLSFKVHSLFVIHSLCLVLDSWRPFFI